MSRVKSLCLVAALIAGLGGCEESKPKADDKPTEKAATSSAPAAASAKPDEKTAEADTGDADADADDDRFAPADYEEESEEDINEANYDAELAELEGEISGS